MKRLRSYVLAFAILPAAAFAKNVDLSTLPPRDTVQLTVYNSADLTLVRETRRITFKKGVNPLQFSWANTLIDPTSVFLRFKTHADLLDLLDTTFPHDKPQMLYWNVKAEDKTEAVVEITYFTSGITWAADYVCTSDAAEEKMSFEGFVRITNNSGEDYADAEIRLVVGTINLTEKIAELARRGLLKEDEAAEFARRGAKVSRMKNEKARAVLALKVADAMQVAESAPVPKRIIKQGLSEYFLYTIPGTETVKNTWSKRMRLFEGAKVPFRIQYRYRPDEYGPRLVRLFLLRNDEAGHLGTTPLPDGVVRLFRENGRDGLAFLVRQSVKYIPIGQEIVLNLGPDPQVIHEHVLLEAKRDNFWFRRAGANLYFNPTKGHRIEINDRVVGWDEHQRWVERIRNYRDKPIDLDIRRAFPGHVVFRSNLNPKLHDYHTVQFAATIDPGRKKDLAYRLTFKQGHNKKQENVTLESAE